MQNQNENQRNLTPNPGTPNQKKSGGGKGCLIAFIAVGGGFAALCILLFLVSMIFGAGSGSSGEGTSQTDVSVSDDVNAGNVVIASNSESGASFNCTFDDVIERFNANIEAHIVNDSGLTDAQYQEFKNMLKISKSEFIQETESKYFYTKKHLQSNEDLYGITINIDDNGRVYCVEMVWQNSLDDSTKSMVMILLRGLISSVETSKSYDEANQIIIDTDSQGGIMQKDHVKYGAFYESDVTRFAALALIDE